jgi:hypothetical protein
MSCDDRGVKKRLNFLGVMDGCLFSLPLDRLGGERNFAWSLVGVAEVVLDVAVLSKAVLPAIVDRVAVGEAVSCIFKNTYGPYRAELYITIMKSRRSF